MWPLFLENELLETQQETGCLQIPEVCHNIDALAKEEHVKVMGCCVAAPKLKVDFEY